MRHAWRLGGRPELADFPAARQHLERALAIREDQLGPDHPDTADSLHHLAATQARRADYRGALPLLRRALDIRERVLGPDHPETARTLNVLALAHEGLDEAGRARALFERALATRERVLGPDHARLARGEGRGEAMRQVRLGLIAGEDDTAALTSTPTGSPPSVPAMGSAVASDLWRHPYYWASFLVSGDVSPLETGAPSGRAERGRWGGR